MNNLLINRSGQIFLHENLLILYITLRNFSAEYLQYVHLNSIQLIFGEQLIMDKFDPPKNLQELSDRDLVLHCKEELPELTAAFTELFYRYRDYVYALTIEKLKNSQDAEDATQEIFIRIFHGLSEFRMEAGLKTWIAVITSNVCLTMVLSEKRKFWKFQVSLDGEADLAGIHSMLLSNQQESDFWEKVGHILRAMYANYRKVFIFKYFKNLSIKTIADKIHSSFGAAKMRIKRAKDQFIKIYFKS